jgi:enamine deaminase RidA (YjgF/YER057c/UK114 family)
MPRGERVPILLAVVALGANLCASSGQTAWVAGTPADVAQQAQQAQQAPHAAPALAETQRADIVTAR